MCSDIDFYGYLCLIAHSRILHYFNYLSTYFFFIVGNYFFKDFYKTNDLWLSVYLLKCRLKDRFYLGDCGITAGRIFVKAALLLVIFSYHKKPIILFEHLPDN